jgi:hypothetical protein
MLPPVLCGELSVWGLERCVSMSVCDVVWYYDDAQVVVPYKDSPQGFYTANLHCEICCLLRIYIVNETILYTHISQYFCTYFYSF